MLFVADLLSKYSNYDRQMLSATTFGHLRNIPVPQIPQINTDLQLTICEITLLSLKRHNKVVCSFQLTLFVAVRTHKNQDKPLALDASLLRDLDGAAVWKSLSKLRDFQPAAPSPYRALHQPQGDKQKINISSVAYWKTIKNMLRPASDLSLDPLTAGRKYGRIRLRSDPKEKNTVTLRGIA